MPLFTAEIPETHLRINRPVIKQVVDDILSRFKNIPFREFRFLGEATQLTTPGSAIDAGAFNRSDADNYVNIEVDDIPDDEYGRSYVVGQNQNKALISCKRTLVDMYPIYQNRKIVIRLEVVCSSRVRLNGLITRMRQAMYQSDTMFTHQISYDYDLPVPCKELLNQVYHLMEANHGYGIDFLTWLKEIKQDHVQMSARLDGKQGMLTIRENAVNVLSNLVEHEEEPVKEKDKDNGVWAIHFDIELRYQRPNVIRCSYPPVIHNSFLPEDWFNKNKTFMYRDRAATSSLANMAMERFKWELGFAVPGKGGLGVKEPYFDDWGREPQNKKMVRLITSLCLVDENDPRQFFNLVDDIQDYAFPDEILKLMRIQSQAIVHEGKHFVHIKAYNGNKQIPEECISVDADLNVKLDRDMDPRGYYHIVICLNVDPTTIPDGIWEDFLCTAGGLATYFSYFGEKYRDLIEAILAAREPDELCLSKEIIDEVIKEIIIDGNDNGGIGGGNGGIGGGNGGFDNGKLYYDACPRRTKLNFSVIGER